MNHKKLNMTEAELLEYCASLNEQELKAFQLECKQHDIDSAKRKMHFAFCNFIVCWIGCIYAIRMDQTILAIILVTLTVFAILFTFGFNKRLKQERTMYKMLQIWFQNNQIL